MMHSLHTMSTSCKQYIDKIMYINLDSRTDRREQIENELNRFGLLAERFSAIPTPGRGIVGCSYSHLAVLKRARENKWRNVLILEDDFEFLVSQKEFDESMDSFFKLNMDYDVLYISYNVIQSEEIPGCSLVRKTTESQTASGYIVHEKFYDKLIALYEWAFPLLDATDEHWNYCNDQVWKNLQPFHQFLYFSTRLGKQRESYSDNTCSFVDHGC